MTLTWCRLTPVLGESLPSARGLSRDYMGRVLFQLIEKYLFLIPPWRKNSFKVGLMNDGISSRHWKRSIYTRVSYLADVYYSAIPALQKLDCPGGYLGPAVVILTFCPTFAWEHGLNHGKRRGLGEPRECLQVPGRYFYSLQRSSYATDLYFSCWNVQLRPEYQLLFENRYRLLWSKLHLEPFSQIPRLKC